MSLHSRYIAVSPDSPRVQISFLRRDLLYKTPDVLICPHDKTVRLHGLPLRKGETSAIGPTVLDMLTCTTTTDDKSEWVWSVRDTGSLWTSKKEYADTIAPFWPGSGKCSNRDPKKALDHPFRSAVVSGGTILSEDDDFVTVQKPSTVSLSAYVFRLAIGMHGSIDAAYRFIADLAIQAWEDDITRARSLFQHVRASDTGALFEEAQTAQFRPSSSVSQAVEATIMRQACTWLGVDPDIEFKRGMGRPKGQATQGTYIDVHVIDDVIHGQMKADYNAIPKGTDLYQVDLMRLVETLGKLRTEKHEIDAELLEAFLDTVQPDWRNQASQTIPVGQESQDPYDILGLQRTATMEEVKAAYKRTMQKVHPDTAGISRVFSQMAAEAYRTIKTERGEP